MLLTQQQQQQLLLECLPQGIATFGQRSACMTCFDTFSARGRARFGQHQESRPNFLSKRKVLVLYSQQMCQI